MASPDDMLMDLLNMVVVSANISTAAFIHDDHFGENVEHCSLSNLSDKVFSSARTNGLSHLVVQLDRHLGEVRRQLTRLKELDMKNYFLLGR